MQPTSYSPTPVKGTMILILGILSIVGLPILGPVAWIMGNNGIQTIDRGNGDFQQRQNTMIGRICGIVGTVILALSVVAIVAALALGLTFGGLIKNKVAQETNPQSAIAKAHARAHGKLAPSAGALDYAIGQNDVAKIRAIAHKNRAALNARDAIGQTPIFLTVTQGKPAMTSLLLRLGANVNAKDNTGATPLDKARALGKDDVLAVLVSHGGRSGKG
ncbi:hypothetical protein CCAX7_15760 [Capsulimonas corticalis]|uniref:Uncharacterized protein n=1 Tax=Capsulimonas corticalis TaxID=2219043 RepID=A0A402CZ44_9BACT|nr:ankyrin repeat domain-containing protein [Capsulimonas corticalis]BDI29525.1 hypothetical protein CCAX7_15760 [Capsulimonas corticalis]